VHQQRAREDQRAAGERRSGERLAEEEPAPEHAEQRNEVGDGQGARHADIGDQAEVEQERHAAREQREREQVGDHERRRHGQRRQER
jgi:hypothetical protein